MIMVLQDDLKNDEPSNYETQQENYEMIGDGEKHWLVNQQKTIFTKKWLYHTHEVVEVGTQPFVVFKLGWIPNVLYLFNKLTEILHGRFQM